VLRSMEECEGVNIGGEEVAKVEGIGRVLAVGGTAGGTRRVQLERAVYNINKDAHKLYKPAGVYTKLEGALKGPIQARQDTQKSSDSTSPYFSTTTTSQHQLHPY